MLFAVFRLVMIGDGATDMETCPPAVSVKQDYFINIICTSVLSVLNFLTYLNCLITFDYV